MPVRRLKEFLDRNNVKYVSIQHSMAYTAMEIAQSAHIPGKEIAKTVVVMIDGDMALAVMPANRKLDLTALRRFVGSDSVRLATEAEFVDRFPECSLGAMPPFGNLYEMKVYADANLAKDEHIAFNAGSHTELIQLPYAEFSRLVEPIVAELS